MAITGTERFREFIRNFTLLVDKAGADEGRIFDTGGELLKGLVSRDDWLPDACALPDRQRYCQYLLHCDPLERFSVVSFVWGPGQHTPVHDHTVWGMIGMLRGRERCREFAAGEPGRPMMASSEHRLEPGEIDRVSPTVGDIHEVANDLADRPSISIHVYGGNIGAIRRHVFDPATGTASGFVSGYSSAVLPNWWDRTSDPSESR